MDDYELYRERFDRGDFRGATNIVCKNPEVMERVTLSESYRLVHESIMRVLNMEEIDGKL